MNSSKGRNASDKFTCTILSCLKCMSPTYTVCTLDAYFLALCLLRIKSSGTTESITQIPDRWVSQHINLAIVFWVFFCISWLKSHREKKTPKNNQNVKLLKSCWKGSVITGRVAQALKDPGIFCCPWILTSKHLFIHSFIKESSFHPFH